MKRSILIGTLVGLGVCGLLPGTGLNAGAGLVPLDPSTFTVLQGNTPGVVGWATPNAQGGSQELQIAQDILFINAGGSISSLPYSFPGETFFNNTAGVSYGGGTPLMTPLVSVDNAKPSNSEVSGYQFAIAKYGGNPNGGGYILFYLGGNDVVLPQNSANLWWNGVSSDSYGISGYTAFNANGTPVPEPSTIFAAALLLVPFGAGVFRVLRKARFV